MMIRHFAPCIAALPLLGLGCGGRSEELAFSNAPITSIAQCPDTGDKVITKICVTDDRGNLYSAEPDAAAPNLGMLIVPAGRAVGVVYVFGDGYAPDANDVTSTSVRAYVGVDNVGDNGGNGSPVVAGADCCAEGNEANRVSSSVSIQGNTMTQRLDAVPPSGVQVATAIDFSLLFRTRLQQPCTLPDGACGRFGSYQDRPGTVGAWARFYVGSVPPASGPVSPDSGL